MGEVLEKAGHALLVGAQELEENGTLKEWAELLSKLVRKLSDEGHDLERRAEELMCRLVERYGGGIEELIEELIGQTVKSWEADELIDRLEHQVGADLQFIRINGTLIGGAVGVLLHGVGLLIW